MFGLAIAGLARVLTALGGLRFAGDRGDDGSGRGDAGTLQEVAAPRAIGAVRCIVLLVAHAVPPR
jgi:hypothetical protein